MKRISVLFTIIALFVLGLAISSSLSTAADDGIINGNSGGNSPAAVNNAYKPSNNSTFNPMFGAATVTLATAT